MEEAQLISGFRTAIDEKKYEDAVNMVIDNGWTFDKRCTNGETFLHIAVNKSIEHFKSKKGDDLELFRLIGNTGTDFCAQDHEERNVIMKIIDGVDSAFEVINETKYRSNDYVVEAIANMAGSEIFTQKDKKGYTVLHYAVATERYYLIDIAVAKGVDINIPIDGGCTMLHMIMQRRDITEAIRMINMGANPLVVDDNGRNILHFLFEREIGTLINYQYKKEYHSTFTCSSESKKANFMEFRKVLDSLEQSGVIYGKNPEGHSAIYCYMIKRTDAQLIDYFIENCFDKLEEEEQTCLQEALKKLAGPGNDPHECYSYYRLLAYRGEDVSVNKNFDEWIRCVKDIVFENLNFLIMFEGSDSVLVQFILRQAMRSIDNNDDEEILEFIKTCIDRNVNCPELIRELKDIDVCINEVYDKDGYTILEHIARNNYHFTEMYKCLPIFRDMDIDIFERNTENRSMFFECIYDEYERLINADSIPDAILQLAELFPEDDFTTADTSGLTSAIYAAGMKDGKLLRLMIEKGIDVNESGEGDCSGFTPLHMACLNECVDNVRMLLDAGADEGIVDSLGNSCAHYLFMSRKALYFDIKDYKYINSDRTGCRKSSSEQSRNAQLEQRQNILESLNCINIVNHQDYTPFMLMVRDDYEAERLFDYFIERGVDINARSLDLGVTALYLYLQASYNYSLFDEFIKNGADINIQDKYGDTLLMMSLKENKFKVFMKLLKAGADCSIANQKGITPVDYATENEMVNYLRQFTPEQIASAAYAQKNSDDLDDDSYDDDDEYEDDEEDEDDEDSYDDDDDSYNDVDDNNGKWVEDTRPDEEKMLECYVNAYGSKGPEILKYALKIAKMGETGFNENNMEEYQRTISEYQALLASVNK